MKKNKNIWFYTWPLIVVFILLSSSCKKEADGDLVSGSGPDVTDIDGNVYHTVYIGSQVWMAENLKTTKFRNGEPITLIIEDSQWSGYKSAAYCNNHNRTAITETYGRLYNGYVLYDPRNIAPKGWHIPSDEEWTTLLKYLGSLAGYKLKEASNEHWQDNFGAIMSYNSSGFTALPAGKRGYAGLFSSLGQDACFWSLNSKKGDSNLRNSSVKINYRYNDVTIDDKHPLNEGLSIRCIKD